MLAITTDYVANTGDPSPYLRRIAEAGFTHVHWCHEWCTDHVYTPAEIRQIGQWLAEFGLKLLDLHGSAGKTSRWFAPDEGERLVGVALVQNRLEMTARLGGATVIMHAKPDLLDPLRRSLDALQPLARQLGVRIAIENGKLDMVRQVIGEYSPEFLGLCYDSGHGNRPGEGKGLDELETLKCRLISLHLHDNDGTADQHKLLFSGTVDWPRLAGLIATSSYTGCVSMESTMRHAGITDEAVFLAQAFETGVRFAAMIDAARAASSKRILASRQS